MDWAGMLQASVNLDRDIRIKHNLNNSLEDRIQEAYISLDVELAEIANAAEWFKVWKTHRGKRDGDLSVRQTVLNEFVDATDFFLLLANLNQWNHLIVISDEELDKFKSDSRNLDLSLMYLNVKKMLYSAYAYNRSTDYVHAWHMFMKLGIQGLRYSPEEIQDSFFQKNQVNHQRQKNNY
ncbi:2-deoxyuridine 5-triphosphate nucleotidohydrolase [Pediococcus stilesii]|uniref:2-deoxyuridine 5-triphosphate nucleotidohydrolase n=1 Tax=Pediococcus stilesii TaxID=331679 RepID=A0A5R9BVH0_9LACO|nr:dUTPase [Pediococcus stilesii]TLQ04649.1 2-deoxyuridine 5-triphosphate nucleotidohydrolase [Pediococcus stilesii]